MLDENEYEEFRFVGMGEKAAIKDFNASKDIIADKASELLRWQEKAVHERAVADKSEESVYSLAYAEMMLRLWQSEAKPAREFIRVMPGGSLEDIIPLREAIFGRGGDDLDDISINVLFKEDSVPIGTGRVSLDMESGRIIIELIGIIESERRRGKGTALLNALMDIAKENETGTIWARPHSDEAGIALLRKYGFEEINPYWMSIEADSIR